MASTLDAAVTISSVKLPRMTEEEFMTWAFAEDVRAEWVNGEVILMSPAALRHIQIGRWLTQVLGIYVQAKQLGEFLGSDYMVRLQHSGVSRRIPDHLFVSKSNLSRLKSTYLDGPPDMAIEVVSPDSVSRDWRDKFLEFETSGVLEYWIIDPISETMEASVRNAEGKFVKQEVGTDGILHSTTVPGFWLKPEWFWQPEIVDPLEHLRTLGVL